MGIHSSYFISEGHLVNERFIKREGWECIRLTLTLCTCWTCCVVVDPWCPTSNNNRLLYNWRAISEMVSRIEYSEQLARSKGLWCCTSKTVLPYIITIACSNRSSYWANLLFLFAYYFLKIMSERTVNTWFLLTSV